MVRIAGIIGNDITDSEDGICVSLWAQGCPHRCKGCHNPETWDFNGGEETTLEDVSEKIIELLNKNGVQRQFSVLGGEPLCKENRKDIALVIHKVRKQYPGIKIYVWTGYTFDELKAEMDDDIKYILTKINVLIEGRYVESLRDTTLKLRGSSNQRILYKDKDF